MSWIEIALIAFVTILSFNYIFYTAGYLWHKGKINAHKEKE